MQRETKEIVLPSGIKITANTYLTARDANAIKEEMYKVMKIDLDNVDDAGNPKMKGDISAEFLLSQEKMLLERVVVSIDGSTENIKDRLYDLRNSDYQALVVEINKLHKESPNLAQVK